MVRSFGELNLAPLKLSTTVERVGGVVVRSKDTIPPTPWLAVTSRPIRSTASPFDPESAGTATETESSVATFKMRDGGGEVIDPNSET
jgi:hypothetical protein